MSKKENMSMKDSNIKWIGKIPQEWEIKRFKNYFTNIGGGNYGNDIQEDSKIKLPCFSISDFKNGNLDSKNKELIKTDRAYDKENTLKKGVILIEKSGGGEKTPVGRMIIVKEDVKAYYTNFVQGIKINNKMNENFILYILKTTYNLRLHMKYVKQNTGLQNFKFNNFANDLLIPVPKLEDQNKIVNFIDYNTITLNKKIKKYNKKIILLKEYKEALIYETVTKGLDKNVEMKDSGIDWIGSIPNTWNIKRLKDFAKIKKGQQISGDENVGLHPYINGGINPSSYIDVYNTKGPVLTISEGGASAGYSQIIEENIWAGAHCYILKTGHVLKYVLYLLKGLQKEIMSQKTGSAMPNLQKSRFENMVFPIVLNKDKQNEIVDFLDKKIKEIDSEVEILSKKIALIEELKESIIHECITGKIDIEVDGEKYQKIIESI